MKIKLDPMATNIKLDAEEFVNAMINREAANNIHLDHEYSAKRKIASDFINNGMKSPPNEFITEAALMNITPEALARKILEKPDQVSLRSLRRRSDVLAIRNATTPGEIDAILARYRPKE